MHVVVVVGIEFWHVLYMKCDGRSGYRSTYIFGTLFHIIGIGIILGFI